MFRAAFAAGGPAAGLPIQATEIATRWDDLYMFVVWLSVFFFILVVGGMIWLAYKYRKGGTAKHKYITGHVGLELFWTAVPTILLLLIFGWGYIVYNDMTRAPSDAMEIRVIGKQWLWQFQYADGRTTVNEVFVPINQPVKLVMTSDDVLHSFFVPNFRVKQDVVPGMYTSVWFEATVPGKHQVYCTEYCGTSHSMMLATVNVLDESQWRRFQKGEKIEGLPIAGVKMTQSTAPSTSDPAATAHVSLAERGRTLMRVKNCIQCHALDEQTKGLIGPTLKGVFGQNVTLTNGKQVTADENYLRRSILEPNLEVVKGYPPAMQTYKGQISEEEIGAIVTYIKSIQ